MTARAAQCRCGVHGFAMNPYYSIPLSTVPYCREARVTLPRRQTACGMRHCCARRIDGCTSRWWLVCTSTRWAERHPQGVCRIRKAAELPTAAQQRVVEAEANRLAKLTRLRRTQAVAFRRHKGCSSLGLPIKRLSFGRSHRPFSFSGKKMGGVVLPPAGGISLRAMRGI